MTYIIGGLYIILSIYILKELIQDRRWYQIDLEICRLGYTKSRTKTLLTKCPDWYGFGYILPKYIHYQDPKNPKFNWKKSAHYINIIIFTVFPGFIILGGVALLFTLSVEFLQRNPRMYYDLKNIILLYNAEKKYRRESILRGQVRILELRERLIIKNRFINKPVFEQQLKKI